MFPCPVKCFRYTVRCISQKLLWKKKTPRPNLNLKNNLETNKKKFTENCLIKKRPKHLFTVLSFKTLITTCLWLIRTEKMISISKKFYTFHFQIQNPVLHLVCYLT